ncbi:hypothetical protein TRVL_00378 [Trypanosoma vivax]|nr:hypothetical protein TRVL_00378 [Trypanosoma vivax]
MVFCSSSKVRWKRCFAHAYSSLLSYTTVCRPSASNLHQSHCFTTQPASASFHAASPAKASSMGFTIGAVVQASLLFLNAMAILSERRLLAKWGLASPAVMEQMFMGTEIDTAFSPTTFSPGDNRVRQQWGSSLKMHIASLLSSVRLLLRWPLIIMNIGVILFTLIFG